MAPAISARSGNSDGRASCAGVPTESQVSASSSRRASSRARSGSGPPTWIQPSLSCGSPSDLEMPSRVKTTARRSVTSEPAPAGSSPSR